MSDLPLNLTPEAVHRQRQYLLALRSSRAARAAKRRERLRELAWVVLAQALGTVLGGVVLLLLGVVAGLLQGIDPTVTGIALALVVSFSLMIAVSMRFTGRPLEEVALELLEREAGDRPGSG